MSEEDTRRGGFISASPRSSYWDACSIMSKPVSRAFMIVPPTTMKSVQLFRSGAVTCGGSSVVAVKYQGWSPSLGNDADVLRELVLSHAVKLYAYRILTIKLMLNEPESPCRTLPSRQFSQCFTWLLALEKPRSKCRLSVENGVSELGSRWANTQTLPPVKRPHGYSKRFRELFARHVRRSRRTRLRGFRRRHRRRRTPGRC